MSTISASVEALLTLDASGFNTGMDKAVKSVDKLVTAMEKVSSSSSTFTNGIRRVRENIGSLSDAVNRLNVSMEKADIFKKVAYSMDKLVTSARQLTEGNISLSGVYQNLQNVVNMFANALSQTEIKLKGNIQLTRQLSEATSSLNAQSRAGGSGYSSYLANINQIGSAVATINRVKASFEGMSQGMLKLTEHITSTSNSIFRFSSSLNSTSSSINTAKSNLNSLGYEFTETSFKASNFASTYKLSTAQIGESSVGYQKAYNDLMKLTRGIQEFNAISTTSNSAMNKTSESTNKLGQSMDKVSTSSNNFKQKLGGLTQSLGMLRSMVSMVGSMFLYNFAHNMMISVQNTVKAKSEMLSFLNTMGLSQAQINGFNSALDQTAERFQRINKYNIGETVANIGLEFDLSAKEMEKAMSVTSMVTSEYLRAGRNADEAALAVKDIMQGQFQRLSRETGVKGEQLKEAGWSGDVNDVMGLMEALEKVAKARHWDTFAEKASSLNDILLITQNRFSEWATDISEGFVPIVTGSFNALINVIDKVTAFFGGLSQSLHLPDWTGTALMVGGLTVAIGTLITTSIMWRTNMGLLQIAQQGLRNSILATVFGIKAEEMANAKASTVLKAKILGVKSETMAQLGVSNILKAKVLGLNAESVAQKGLSGAIAEANIKRMAETSATTKQTAKNVSLLSSYVALQRQLPLTAVEGLKWHQKLALLNKEITVGKAENMNFLQSLKAMITGLNGAKVATTALTASIVALAAVAIGAYVVATMKSTKTMKEFNDMAENGEEKIRKIKDAMGENSEQAKNMTEAVERVRSALSKFETRKMEASDRAGRTVAKYLEEAQVDEEKIKEITDSALRDANAGVSIVAKTGDEIEKTYRGAANSIGLMKGKLSKEEMEQYANDMLTSADRIAKAQEKMMMSDSAMDRAFGWFDFSVEQVGHWWTEFSTNLEHQDWGSAWQNIWKGFMHGFGNIPIASDIWNTIFKALNVESFVKKGDLGGTLGNIGGAILSFTQGLGKAFDDAILDLTNSVFGSFADFWIRIGDGLMDGAKDIFNGISKLPQIIMDAIGGIFGGGDGSGGGLMKKIDPAAFLKNIFGAIDSSGVGEWFNNTVVKPFSDAINNFMSDPIGAVMETVGGFGIFNLIDKLFGMDGGDGDAMSWSWMWVESHITMPLREAFAQLTSDPLGFLGGLIQSFINLPSMIAPYLSQVVTSIISFGSQLLTNGINAGANFLNGVVTHISQLPSRVLSFITSTASNIINGASQWVSNARNKATETVNAVITQVSQLPNKVYNEFVKIASRIRDAVSEAVRAATSFGEDVKNAVLNALGIHSPGIVQEKIATEFANIGGRIKDSIANVKDSATQFGQGVYDGIQSQLPNIQAQSQMISDAMNVSATSDAMDFSGQFVGDYQADATAVTGLNQMMTTDTTTTFGVMGDTVNNTISGISTNLQTSYLNMNTSQTSALTTMQNQNKTAYTNLQNQTTTSLNNMRSTTQNVTVQMVNAWNHMKNNIVASADQLKTQSTAHFNTLSSHIGTFYRKLQNPSMWGGSGDNVPKRYYNHSRGQRGIRAVKQTFGALPNGKYGGSPTPNTLPTTMSLRKLKELLGNDELFDGLYLDQIVNVRDFLAQFEGGFGWNNWHPNHFNKIKSTSGDWKMKGPQIMHRIDTGESFQVKEFYNSRPNISFGSFQHMAEALFSAIPYDFYYNSDKHGSWQAALEAGSCNCYDGANALIALANTCGFSGSLAHGTWNGIPHVYAVINGVKMDTTGWQQRRSWSGVSAGSPPNMGISKTSEKSINITVDMTGSTIYGVEELDSRIEDATRRALQEEVNTSITVGI